MFSKLVQYQRATHFETINILTNICMKPRHSLSIRAFLSALILLLTGVAAARFAAPAFRNLSFPHSSDISRVHFAMENNHPPYAFLDGQGKLGASQTREAADIFPYLGIGATAAIILIAVLFLFTHELQRRVKTRTQELERTLERLKASETRFREALEFLPIAISIIDDQGSILEVNRKFTEQYGYGTGDFATIMDWALMAYPDPAYRKEAIKQWRLDAIKVAKGQATAPAREYSIADKYGNMHDVEAVMRPVGNLWLVAFTDVTERRRAEKTLRAAETKYHALIENAPEVIYLDEANESSSNVYVSAGIEKLTGYTIADFARDPNLWHKLVHPEDYQTAARSIEKTLLHGGAAEEYRLVRRDGAVIWVRDTSTAVRDDKGAIAFVQGFISDITDRKQIEEKLLESERRYRALFEDSPIPLIEEDLSELKTYVDELKESGVEDLRAYFKENPRAVKKCVGMVRVVDLNKSALEWHHAGSKAHIQGSLGDLLNPDWYDSFVEEMLALVEHSSHYEVAISRLDRNGNPLYIIITGAVIPGYEETWERALVSIVDITSRKQAEENLAKQLELVRGLRAIDQALITNIDFAENLNILLREILAQLRVDAASISLFKNDALQFAAGQGFRADAQTFAALNEGSGLAKRVARELDNVHVRDLQEMAYSSVPARVLKEEGFVAYYGVPLVAKEKLLGILEIFHRSPLNKNENWLSFLDMLAGQAAITINSVTLFNALQFTNAELQQAYDATLEGWSRALDLRDEETEGHTRRVTELTLRLAEKFGFTADELVHVKRGSLLHDIGKMGIPDAILLKPASLTEDEWVIMRKHATYAYELLAPIKYLQPALDIPYYHHERWDGSGYPKGLKAEKIPLSARIFSVVDVWDALASDRPYRGAWEPDKIKDYLRENTGTKFDPRVVAVFLKMMDNDDT